MMNVQSAFWDRKAQAIINVEVQKTEPADYKILLTGESFM